MKIEEIKLPKAEFINGWCRDEEVVLVHRGKEAKKKQFFSCTPDWYFFLRRSDATANKQFLVDMKSEGYIQRFETYFMNAEFVKIYCQNRNLTKWRLEDGESDAKTVVLRLLADKGIPTFEADLTSLQRLMIDRQIKIATKYRTVTIDIETKDTDESGHRCPIDMVANPIISCAFYYQCENGAMRSQYVDGNEAAILHTILKFCAAADVVLTFNGNGFDLPYIETRLDLHNIEFNHIFKSVIFIDVYAYFKKIHAFNSEIKSYSLDSLASYFLKKRKVEHEGTIWQLYQTDRAKFREYNITDTVLTWELVVDQRMMEFLTQLCTICGMFLSQYVGSRHSKKGFYGSLLIDTYILRRAHAEGEPVHTTKVGVKTGQFFGGLVLDPEPGRYDGVAVFDFRALYPSVIQTFNIGTDTLMLNEDMQIKPSDRFISSGLMQFEEISKAIGIPIFTDDDIEKREAKPRRVGFRNDMESELAKTCRVFNEERARCRAEMKVLEAAGKKESHEYKRLDLEQATWKIMSNSVYGITASIYSRYFARDVAESITVGARCILVLTIKWFRDHGFTVIYGDTDSIFVVLSGHDPREILKLYHTTFHQTLAQWFGCPKSFIELQHEKTFSRMFIGSKKYYGGMIEGKFKGKGLDFIKRDVPPLIQKIHKELSLDVVTHARPAEFYAAKLREWKKMILEDEIPLPVLEQLVIWKKVQKAPSEYVQGRALPIQVQVYQDLLDQGEQAMPGMAIPLIRVKPDGRRQGNEDALHLEHFKRSNRELDRDHYWNKQFFNRFARVLAAVFPSYDWDKFDTEEVTRRKKQFATWAKEIRNSKKLLPTQREVVACPWLSAAQREKILSRTSPEEAIIFLAEARKGAAKRRDKFMKTSEITDRECPSCGRMGDPTTPFITGLVLGRIHTNRKDLCLNCGYESAGERIGNGPPSSEASTGGTPATT